MSVLKCSNVSFSFGNRTILENASFVMQKGEHIGLIGLNGEGKSTFIKMITGDLTPDDGKIEWAKRITTGYLDQYTSLGKGKSIKDVLDDFYNDQITYRVSDTAGNSWDANQQINLADILPGFKLDLNRGFAGNEEEFKEALEDWYNRQVEEYNKQLEANPDDVELKNKLSWIEAVYNTFL